MTMSPTLAKFLHARHQARKARRIADRFVDKADSLGDQANDLYESLDQGDREEVRRRIQFSTALFMIGQRAKILMALQKVQNPIWRLNHTSPEYGKQSVQFLDKYGPVMLDSGSSRYPLGRATQISSHLDAILTLKGKAPCHGTKDPQGNLTMVLKELKLDIPSLLPA